jgi:hypothetical protein
MEDAKADEEEDEESLLAGEMSEATEHDSFTISATVCLFRHWSRC